MMKKYRIILSEDTFLWIKNNEGLVYPSKNGRAFIFSQSEKLREICRHLLVLEHLYTLELTEEELNVSNVRHFVDQLLEIDAGRLIPITSVEKGAVSLMPVLKIHETIDDFVLKHERGVGGKIIQHIHELTFYVNGSNYGNDRCYWQTVFPTKHESVLEAKKIIRFIRNCKNPFLTNINLVGNIFSFPDFEGLLHHAETFEISVTIRVRDFTPCKDCIYQWLCPSPSNYEIVIGRSNLCYVKS